ncbi:Thioredoxin domain-containing protein 17 [Taenia crassiceps]|uniref:Thioredoxin domain-containing protein 17 n=1 Tax=Taenia crassiceps TaxID=6207 RepID=A0ABR4QP85_9CEST
MHRYGMELYGHSSVANAKSAVWFPIRLTSSIMPAKQIYLRSHKEVGEQLEELFASNSEQKVILLLEGSTDMTGESWNSACQEVELLLEPLLNSASEKTVFLMAEVGNEEAWLDENNFFKKHAIYKLTAIPTLLLFSGPESVANRLDGSACLDRDALTEFFK